MTTETRPGGLRPHVRCLLLTASLVVLAATAVRGAEPLQGRVDEEQVKAAFLYNFLKFVQWPPSDHRPGPLVIGVVGDDSFNEVLESIVRGKNVNGRDIVVRQVRTEADARMCHIVFVGASEARRTADIVEHVRGAGVLTVGETPYFLHDGGIVQFVLHNNRLRFRINAILASQDGLKISSQLLSLAKPWVEE